MNRLSQFIREKRKDELISQENFAKKIGISVVTLSKIESSSKVGFKTLHKIAEYFNIPTKNVRRMMILEDNEQE